MELTANQILDSFDSGIIILDEKRSVCAWNRWIEDCSHVKKQNALNKNLEEIFKCELNFKQIIDEVLVHGRSRFLSPRLHKHPLPLYKYSKEGKNKELIYQKIVVSRIKLEHGKFYCVINISDESASIRREIYLKEKTRKLKKAQDKIIASEKEIRKIAFFDNLTDLANRGLFLEHLDMALAQSKRDDYMVSVILIDIDYFKFVNDTYGHDVGDKLLVEIAKRLKDCVRQSDMAARLGGDEFAVIQHKVSCINDAAIFVKKIHAELSEPLFIEGIKINPSSSIGVSIFPNDASTRSELLKNADLAMYKVKKEGRSGWQFYADEMRQEERARLKQKDELTAAIRNNNIVVHYQPEMDIRNSQLAGFEALVRYVDTKNHLIMPDEFISFAEESGLITDITMSMIEKISKASELRKNTVLYKIALNLSSMQFYDEELIDELIKFHINIKKNNMQLELEITESIVMENTNYAIDIFNRLNSIGISVAIDDFGTGYSSLEYLKQFQIDKLKIARPFIADLNRNQQNNIITDAVISLAHNLGLQVVGEGVETQQQHDYLMQKGCDIGQGFYYSRPLDEANMLSFINEKKVA